MNKSNFEPLTPTAYLDRSAEVFADKTAVVDGARRFSYQTFRDRCLRQAGVLAQLGVKPGDRVAVLAPNTHLMLEAHYGVLYAGAVLVALNTRLSAEELTYILDHSGCQILLHDSSLAGLAKSASDPLARPIKLVDGGTEYERLLSDAEPLQVPVRDEQALMAINYTSGTTGRPKGVMYSHRGAYLQSLAMISHFKLDSETSYLWTLPMFHCNGWTFTWAVTAAGGLHVCLPKVDFELAWKLIAGEAITHMCAAPTVLNYLVSHKPTKPLTDRTVTVAVGGAPPSPALFERCADFGLGLTHLYGLTETYGPVVICDWREEWNELPIAEQFARRARQGVGNIVSCQIRVIDDAGDVLRDGTAIGEIAIRGNNLMLGYYHDDSATNEAIPDGWFRTGDLGVQHPDGYVEIRDRAKDVIISGGENISSVEIEAVLASHPAVLESAVIPIPDEYWGERPGAWVTLREGQEVTAEELKTYLRGRLAGFKLPDEISFGDLPKTATGKIKKFELRDAAWAGRSRI